MTINANSTTAVLRRQSTKVSIAILAASCLTAGLTACSTPAIEATALNSSASVQPTLYMASSSVIDRNSPQQVAGFASDVFFGDVIEAKGSTEKRGVLESQFLVRVTETLKGNAQGEVVVNQQGGSKDGTTWVEEGTELLATGRSYLIAARYNPTENWYSSVPVGGDIPVSDSSEQARGMSGRPAENRDEVRATMRDAIANQIPLGDGPPTATAPTPPPARTTELVPPTSSVAPPSPTSSVAPPSPTSSVAPPSTALVPPTSSRLKPTTTTPVVPPTR